MSKNKKKKLKKRMKKQQEKYRQEQEERERTLNEFNKSNSEHPPRENDCKESKEKGKELQSGDEVSNEESTCRDEVLNFDNNGDGHTAESGENNVCLNGKRECKVDELEENQNNAAVENDETDTAINCDRDMKIPISEDRDPYINEEQMQWICEKHFTEEVELDESIQEMEVSAEKQPDAWSV